MLELRAGEAITFNGRGSCAQRCIDTPEWSGADEELAPVPQSLSGSASTPHDPASHGAGRVRLRREYLGLKTTTGAPRGGGNAATIPAVAERLAGFYVGPNAVNARV